MELPCTESGNSYLIVFQDFLTKFLFMFPAPDQKSIRIAQLFTKEIVPIVSVPIVEPGWQAEKNLPKGYGESRPS